MKTRAENLATGKARAIFLTIDTKTYQSIVAMAQQERRKPGPMAAEILRRYFDGQKNGERS